MLNMLSRIRCMKPYSSVPPIIVSSNIFLAIKVTKLGIGYHVNALNKQEIVSFINGLTILDIIDKLQALETSPKEFAINKNPVFDYLGNAMFI